MDWLISVDRGTGSPSTGMTAIVAGNKLSGDRKNEAKRQQFLEFHWVLL